MAKLPQLSGAEVVRRLKRLGMEEDHTSGGHMIMRNPTTGQMTAVPQHGSTAVKKGTLGAILKQLDISKDEFSAGKRLKTEEASRQEGEQDEQGPEQRLPD